MLQHGQTLRRKEAAAGGAEDAETSSDDADGEQMIHESTSRKTTLEDMEGSFSEDDEDAEEVIGKVGDSEGEDTLADVKMNATANSGQEGRSRKAQKNLRINPSQYLVVEAEQSVTSHNDTGAKVALAFAGDDDVIAEFAAEKAKVLSVNDLEISICGFQAGVNGQGLASNHLSIVRSGKQFYCCVMIYKKNYHFCLVFKASYYFPCFAAFGIDQGSQTRGPHAARETILCGPRPCPRTLKYFG